MQLKLQIQRISLHHTQLNAAILRTVMGQLLRQMMTQGDIQRAKPQFALHRILFKLRSRPLFDSQKALGLMVKRPAFRRERQPIALTLEQRDAARHFQLF
ncbi:hypothetical protein [Serratia marcescens]|uniref:hypothetical protein n=1 Tax=Serratia marcescens TaxID=615 RepID=UPI001C57DC45|nr:hypothetical protein [Serratia marcescens]